MIPQLKMKSLKMKNNKQIKQIKRLQVMKMMKKKILWLIWEMVQKNKLKSIEGHLRKYLVWLRIIGWHLFTNMMKLKIGTLKIYLFSTRRKKKKI